MNSWPLRRQARRAYRIAFLVWIIYMLCAYFVQHIVEQVAYSMGGGSGGNALSSPTLEQGHDHWMGNVRIGASAANSGGEQRITVWSTRWKRAREHARGLLQHQLTYRSQKWDKVQNILDTWFKLWLWPFATMGSALKRRPL